MDIVIKKVDELIPYFQNPRVISEQAVSEVAKSFNNHGIQQVICIDENNVIVAGHTRLLAAKKLGIKEMPCTVYKGNPEDINAYRLADNKVDLPILNFPDLTTRLSLALMFCSAVFFCCIR